MEGVCIFLKLFSHLSCFDLYFIFTGKYTYMHTTRRPKIDGQVVEVRRSLSRRDYEV